MLGVPEDRITVIYEAADPRMQPDAAGRGAAARAGALRRARRFHPVRLDHRAAQERRRPAARLPAPPRRLQAHAGPGPGRVARLAQRQTWASLSSNWASSSTPISSAGSRRTTCLPVQRRPCLVHPGVLRGLRPDAARGDGVRHADDRLQRLQPARGRGRRGPARRSAAGRRDHRGALAGADRRRRCAIAARRRAQQRAAASPGAAPRNRRWPSTDEWQAKWRVY